MTDHTVFHLAGRSLILCSEHRADALMWLWQEFDGAWTASVTGDRSCDACAGASVPAAFQSAVDRQQKLGPVSNPGRPVPVVRHAPRTLSALS